MNIEEIKLLDIQPSQFYISAKKLERVKSWFDPKDLSNFEPLPIFEHGGKIFFTDGHNKSFFLEIRSSSKKDTSAAENADCITEIIGIRHKQT